MKDPKVSVLIATYNRHQFIAGAVKSVLAQTVGDWEIVISDDSEGNETEKAIRQLSDDPRIRYFHRTTKGNIANSSNFAISKAKGEYVAILDDDDEWIDERKLEKQIAFLEKNGEYVACGGGFVMVDGEGKELGRILKPETDGEIRQVALSANPIANSTAIFRRSCNATYDERLTGFADWDFWLNMGNKGKLYNFPEYFLGYRMWNGGGSFIFQKENARAAMAIVKRHRHEYPGFGKAFILAELYLWYAFLPSSIRKRTNEALSALKKRLFSK